MLRSLKYITITLFVLCNLNVQANDHVLTKEESKVYMDRAYEITQKEEFKEKFVKEFKKFDNPQVSDFAGLPKLDVENMKGNDLQELVAKYNQTSDQLKGKKTLPVSKVFTFVSFSMPNKALIKIAKDAKKAGVPVYIRGLVDNSITKTTKVMSEFIKSTKEDVGGFNIDPRLFELYKVDVVPAVVVLTSELSPDAFGTCGKSEGYICGEPSYAKIKGNVSLNYALSTIGRHANAQDIVKPYLDRLNN